VDKTEFNADVVTRTRHCGAPFSTPEAASTTGLASRQNKRRNRFSRRCSGDRSLGVGKDLVQLRRRLMEAEFDLPEEVANALARLERHCIATRITHASGAAGGHYPAVAA
jgi:hypothetical protein